MKTIEEADELKIILQREYIHERQRLYNWSGPQGDRWGRWVTGYTQKDTHKD
jgi:hypothetical protein